MRKDQKSFTLLEVVIVIIIIGVLTSLALPRLMLVVERARAIEAVNALRVWRGAIERCILMNDNDYSYCVGGFDRLDIDSPFEAPNSHFRASAFGYNVDESAYMIVAERNSLDLNLSDPGGSISCGYFGFPPESRSRVALCYHGLNREIKVVGSGLYKGLNF